MTPVTLKAGEFTVDADLIAAAFALDQQAVQAKMRAGEITSRCATGIGEDEGRFLHTFHYQARARRLIVDGNGAVLAKAMEIDGRRRAGSGAAG